MHDGVCPYSSAHEAAFEEGGARDGMQVEGVQTVVEPLKNGKLLLLLLLLLVWLVFGWFGRWHC